MPKPIVLLDLDRMLFDTDRFMADVSQVLQKLFSIDTAELVGRYTEFCVYNDEMRHYDFFKHMRALGLDPDEVDRALAAELSGNTYAYEDVARFLEFVKPKAAYMMVLTHGEHRFQYLKYGFAPELKSLDFKDVLAHKREYIAQTFRAGQGVLIDDAHVGRLPAGFHHILVSRYQASGAYHSLDEVAAAWPSIA